MQPALLAADADEYSVTRSLEAYLLWLFGYIMFNNTNGNSVDRILLPYAREIADGDEDVPPYSWGEAVLAATYCGLCDGCMKTLLSVETHRRAATGNTKSREVAGALAGAAPSSMARNSVTRPEVLWKTGRAT